MDLILWRHAQAEELSTLEVADDMAQSHARDLARRLTRKGERQAAQMGAWLSERLHQDARILVSPAVRTQQTAKALGRAFETLPSIDPQADVADLVDAVAWPNGAEVTVLVGHQPTLGLLASRLLAQTDQAWSIRKGAVWWIRGRERGGHLQTVLLTAQHPDYL